MIEKTGLLQVNTLARSVCYLRQSVVACALDHGDVCVCLLSILSIPEVGAPWSAILESQPSASEDQVFIHSADMLLIIKC